MPRWSRLSISKNSEFQALDMNKFDGWATHANVHVLEMTDRFQEGIDFLEDTVDDWTVGDRNFEIEMLSGRVFAKPYAVAQMSFLYLERRLRGSSFCL